MEASVSTMSGASEIQCMSIGAVVKAFLSASNDFWQLSEKTHGIPFQVNRVSGTVRLE